MSKIIETKEERKKNGSDKVEVPRSGDAVGIRATLNNMGFSNSDIGYDDASGMVTLKGKKLIKPSYLDNDAGVSYATNSDIQKSLVDYYQDSKNPIVRVSDAYANTAAQYGLGADALSYGNGTVSIGGKPLDILYIDDSGKAWAWQNDVADLTETYANGLGVESSISLAERYADKYLTGIRDKIDELENRKEFSYNPDNDPVYLAYKNKYLTEGDRASRNAMADYSALTGGYTNSAAVTAGAMANQYYAQQLANTIPTLAEQAYQRYYDSYMADFDILDKMIDVYNADYKNAAAANEAAMDAANYSAASTIARDEAAYEKVQAEFERYWDERFNNQKYDTQERENYWNELFNPIKLEDGILDNQQQEIYLEYYERLLEEELEGKQLSNQKTSLSLWGY